MDDFVKKDPLKNTTVKLDPKKVQEAREQNLNISKICRKALDLALEGKLLEDGPVRKKTG